MPMNSPRRRDAGAIVRSARLAKGLTLAELGRLTGYSSSQVSRYERGIAPLTDTAALRNFAAALSLPPQTFGLAPNVGGSANRPPLVAVRAVTDHASAVVLSDTTHASRADDTISRLADLVYGQKPTNAQPISLTDLRAETDQARGLLQAARYEQLTASLPRLIATATATRDAANDQDRQAVEALLADAYIAASAFMVKIDDHQLTWTTADRALQSAAASGDPLTLADAQRSVAVAMRRTGRPDRARSLLIDASDAIAPGYAATREQLSMYGTLLQVAAYTAAVDGDQEQANELITAAHATAVRLGGDANHRYTAFGPTTVSLYHVSIAQALGDNGTAIQHAKMVNPATIPTPERRGRYWIRVARAWHQWGKLDACYRSLLMAERVAPAEVRFRPVVRRIAHDLLRTARSGAMPGLRAFAERVGVLA
ncbi:helix-turn-helix transcriptional regulator [Nonomuraea angiospora]|uniref:helix-turn-helix domain-containing protein n=1 Tax=Nonomuraea angiospora TaxID=46172 RepID=UPI0034508950